MPARTFEEALAEVKAGAGTQFDPKVVENFCRLLPLEGDLPAGERAEDGPFRQYLLAEAAAVRRSSGKRGAVSFVFTGNNCFGDDLGLAQGR